MPAQPVVAQLSQPREPSPEERRLLAAYESERPAIAAPATMRDGFGSPGFGSASQADQGGRNNGDAAAQIPVNDPDPRETERWFATRCERRTRSCSTAELRVACLDLPTSKSSLWRGSNLWVIESFTGRIRYTSTAGCFALLVVFSRFGGHTPRRAGNAWPVGARIRAPLICT